MDRLIEHAESMGCRVFFLPLTEYDGYLASSRDIIINSRLHSDYQREVLAHELGHVYYGHDARHSYSVERDERQADAFAANLLISPLEYAAAERIYGPHPGALAEALNVSVEIIEAWRRRIYARVA